LAEERQRGFDLSRPPLLRCHLARLGEQSYQFVWCFHHLLLDGWSLPILFRELFSLLAMPTADLPPLRPYQDYIAWLQRQDVEAAAEHWRGYLAGFNAPTPLPGGRQVAGEKSAGHYAEVTFTLDEPASRRILQFASAQHLTVSTLLQTAWALLLERYSGEPDVVFGVTVSGRNIDLHGIDHMLGLFINTVPLRLRIDDDPLWALLQATQGEHQRNLQFSHMSLSEIQRCSAVPNGTPLFGTILVLENYPMETSMPQDEQGGLRFINVQAADHTSYPLTIVAAAGQTFQFRIGYDTYHFERASIERLFGHLRNLLLGIATSDAECRSRDLWLMDSGEQEQLIGWSRAKQPASEPQTLVEMFAAQVARDPARVAVTCNGEQVTYQQLSARAKQLAQRLRRHGTGPDRLVGLCASRSLELVVGILGILESGAAYLPLDPDVPPSRLAFMLEDADAVAVVTQRALAERLPEVDVPRLYLDGFEESDGVAAEGQDVNQAVGIQPQHLAYVIYTSGSTGQPKGVMVTHANVTRLFAATWPEFHFSTDDVWTLFHSVAFDFSVWELWGALLFGGRLVIVPHHISRDPVAFYDLLEAEGVTILNQTPSAFRQLIPVAQRMGGRLPLRLVIFGGEALDLPTLRPWFDLYGDQRPRLINMYGITETTVHVTWCPLRSSDTQSTASLIGRPLADLDVYLLDGQGRPVPQGVAGEIYVGGAGLARGYLNRPALSEERFIEQDVFGQRLRLYRSGDMARWGANGNLAYLGRIDHQIKLRGFRIELGEIESTLSQHPEVREAVVVARGLAPQQYLVACLVLKHQEVTSEELRQWLATRLPNYMIPTHLIVLDSLPLTVNGKVDQQALPEPRDVYPPGTAVYVPPRDNVEKQLVSIWQEALDCTNIGIEDNFFELGGHSLTAMQIVSAIYKTIGVKIPLHRLFEHPTIAALAAITKTSRDGAYLPIEPVPIQPDYPLSHSQLRLWLDNKMAGSATFNMPEALLFNENLDVAALKQALNALVMRHETLRTSFIEVEGKPRQRIHSQLDISIAEVDLSTETRFDERTREIIDQEAIIPFDVEMLPLFRVTLIKQSGTRCILVLVIHHIIGDGWSKNVLYQELSILYNAFSHGLPNPLEPLRIQYKDYAVWETTLSFEQAERYWLDELAGAPTHISLPYDFLPPVERLFYGDRRSLTLGPETSQELRNLAASRGTTLSTVMFALFQLFLFQISRQDDLCVSTVVANRNHPDLENQIGCFVNILPVRTRLSQDMEFEQLLNQIIRSSYAVLEHQNYPFDRLVRHFNRAGGLDLRPFLDVGYLFQNSFDTHLKIAAQIPHDIPRQEGSVEFSFGFAKFDLSLTIIDQGPLGITLIMEYDSALFLEKTILGYLNTLERFAIMAAGWSKATSGKSNTGV
jgi:amino acid adenylation domain-containing protein